jgi:hypothetical protein
MADSPPSSLVSFTTIQQSQLDESTLIKDKRSFREIQEEEQARQIEEDFLKWWSLEEERIKLATQLSSHSHRSRSQTKDRFPRKKPSGSNLKTGSSSTTRHVASTM